MRKVFIVALALMMALCLVGCGKSEEAKIVDELIAGIGEVTLDSKEAIETAQKQYDALTDEQKEEVENYSILTLAQEKLTKAKEEFVEDAKSDATEMMLYKRPEEAVAVLEKALEYDPSVQDDLDIIYSWCYEIEDVLFIKPDLLYSDIEYVGQSTDEGEPYLINTEVFTIPSFRTFQDYVIYATEKFTVNEDETIEEGALDLYRYQFLSKTSGAVVLQLTYIIYESEYILIVSTPPQT